MMAMVMEMVSISMMIGPRRLRMLMGIVSFVFRFVVSVAWGVGARASAFHRITRAGANHPPLSLVSAFPV